MQRILVIRIDFLGDMVCTTPFLHSLRVRWPQAEIHVLANKYNAPVLDNNPDVNVVHQYIYSKNRSKNPREGFFNSLTDRLCLILRLRKIKFDLVVIPNGGMNKNAINFAKQLNVPDCRWHNADTEFDDRKRSHVETRPMMHEALSGYKLVPELAIPEVLSLRVYPHSDLKIKWHNLFRDKQRCRVGLFVSNNSYERSWDWDKWKSLADALAVFYEVVVFHSPEEIFPEGWDNMANVCRVSTPTLPDLTAAMTHLQLTVSADSAPVHLSCALNIPVVALFESRPEKYLRWYPVGVRNIMIHEGKRVNDISVSSVLTAVKKVLDEAKSDEV
ncbi:glycosyltransferase family 9 protein [Erwinia psidii]|uniref:Lipopolysaccharide heptosyltransferase family protein n=1 Tax=Erwinia psidii TaxID=69224 RepID=A0A3N6SF48_9GAMM|nr:glycosyltransferase family 9 protein [Erwinia psidii]MCX8959172.1 lipopolysaccharide heptosyltransferase family protein [Erwinia psidii]MCX8962210.1 lipopolysaccharide heptosyltransferase family protein [Erwinia psidii]MCX8966742.1 lipopolysaccharide heptosyltransferase family protein [Erwinia psidii]RQM37281.1 lipopolysaccharide heptosyltransferase family protein [Erwinia psidii]